jgi:hypothetical protein
VVCSRVRLHVAPASFPVLCEFSCLDRVLGPDTGRYQRPCQSWDRVVPKAVVSSRSYTDMRIRKTSPLAARSRAVGVGLCMFVYDEIDAASRRASCSGSLRQRLGNDGGFLVEGRWLVVARRVRLVDVAQVVAE